MKDLELIHLIFQVEILEIQVIVYMIMLTRSLERIFNPMRWTGLFIIGYLQYSEI